MMESRGTSHRPLVIAHRGASGYAPENTLAAFARAIEMGADGVEFDVRLTSDDHPVVFHDKTVRRMTGERREVRSMTLTQLRSIDAGSWFNRRHLRRQQAEFRNLRVPALSEALRKFEGRSLTLFVELKDPEDERPALEQAALEALRKNDSIARAIMLSFDHTALHRVRACNDRIRIAPLFLRRFSRPAVTLARMTGVARSLGATGVALEQTLANSRRVGALHDEGLHVYVWTVNSRVRMRRFIRLGVDGIMTNYPDVLRAEIERVHSPE